MLSKKLGIKRNKFILVGILFIFISLTIPVSTFAPVLKSEIIYQLDKKTDKPTEIVPINLDFSIIIPKINANAKVIKNVDPFNSKIYQRALTQGVAHAKDTSTPDKSGNTFIFAHSAGNWYEANQFNAVFYLLNKLETGDEIIVYYQSQKYIYTVNETKIINGNELNYMSSKIGQNQLTLMTCWPPGTTLKRLVVISTLKND
ncbi:MAG: sortase [Candidatus Shapirobacteria bacterium]|nr:sortase [Candidatus Shapirobacteria bacterium]MDD4410804.1 sortase [Candidatus Shapirobacteria bacterium]